MSTYNVIPALEQFLVPIEDLIELPGNARRGDIEALKASLLEFGQIKAIIGRPNPDGTMTVPAGNNLTKAARELGWTHLAAIPWEASDQRAVAYAITDNRTSELGHTDAMALDELIEFVVDDYTPLLDDLGWDDFELAAIGEVADRAQAVLDDPRGYIPPEIILPDPTPAVGAPPTLQEKPEIVAPEGTDTREAIIHGAAATSRGAGGKGVVQYNLVFDNIDQQNRWHQFLRWLRSDPGTDGATTSERLLDFLEARADF